MKSLFKNFRAFNIKFSEFKKVVQFIEDLIGKERVIKEIQKSFNTLSNIKLEDLQQQAQEIGIERLRTELETHSLYHFRQLQSNGLQLTY